jgi:3-oxoadipate enol-lactonase
MRRDALASARALWEHPDEGGGPVPHAQVNGIALNYRIDGPEGAPWLTFGNSLCCDLSMWQPQAEFFSRRYRVLRYDTRGHGHSEASSGPYSFDLLVADVIGLWDALGIARSHWVGLSMGGMAGFGLALDHAQRVGALVCCDCRAQAPQAYAAFMAERIRITREQGMVALVEPTLSRWFLPQTLAAQPRWLDALRASVAATSVDGHIGCCEAIRALDYEQRLGAISNPCLLLGGEADVGAPPDVMGAIAQRIPGAQHQVIANAGHISNLEQVEAFNAAVDAFLRPRT